MQLMLRMGKCIQQNINKDMLDCLHIWYVSKNDVCKVFWGSIKRDLIAAVLIYHFSYTYFAVA